jgi:hypothetical protein
VLAKNFMRTIKKRVAIKYEPNIPLLFLNSALVSGRIRLPEDFPNPRRDMKERYRINWGDELSKKCLECDYQEN